MKKENQKRYAVPIIITLILSYPPSSFALCINLSQASFSFSFGIINFLKPRFLLIFPIALAGVLIYVCIDRIKEIRSGEEDDLGKY